jgi:hypothetical protein
MFLFTVIQIQAGKLIPSPSMFWKVAEMRNIAEVITFLLDLFIDSSLKLI